MTLEENIALAFDLNLCVPKIHILSAMSDEELERSIPEVGNTLELRDTMLFQKIMGIPVSFHCWLGKTKTRFVSLHDRRLLAGGRGPSVQDNLCTVFKCEKFPKMIEKAIVKFKKKSPLAEGWLSIDAILDDLKRAWYDSIREGLTEEEMLAMHYLKDREKGFGSAVMLYEFPDKKVGVLGGFGNTVNESWHEVYIQAQETNACYRNDGKDAIMPLWRAYKHDYL